METGFVHLGSPVGSQEYVVGKIASRVEKVKGMLDVLHRMENPHCEFALLRSCFSSPKVSYLLRTTPPVPHCVAVWQKFDGLVRDSFNRILGSSLTDTAWSQAQLTSSRGGFGLRSAALHSSAAYLASSLEAQHLVEEILVDTVPVVPYLQESLNHFAEVLQLEEPLIKEVLVGEKQRALSLRIDCRLHTSLVESADSTRDKVRYGSLGLPHAGDWVNVVPCSTLGLQL